MRYLIDGYNLLFASPSKETLQKKREQVLRFLASYSSCFPLLLVVVFDGQNKAPDIVRTHIGNLEVIYTAKNQTADAFILEELLAIKPKQSTIVSSDHALTKKAKALGAHTMSVEAFLAFLEKKKGKKTAAQEEKPSCDSIVHKKRLESVFEKLLEEPKN